MQKKIAAIIMGILGIIMIFLGWKIQGLPPAITGIGFLVIGHIFYHDL